MRRVSEPRGDPVRRDVLAVAGAGATSNEDDDFAAWVAHRKTKEKGAEKKTEDSRQKKVNGEATERGPSEDAPLAR